MIVDLLWRRRMTEHVRHERGEGVVYVTDLCRCPLKRELEERYPALAAADVYSPSALLGDLAHRGLASLLAEELEGFRPEVEVEARVGPYLVRGRLDGLIERGGERIGVELKTSGSDVGLPRDHHLLQCSTPPTWST